jgi:hypothetical protein
MDLLKCFGKIIKRICHKTTTTKPFIPKQVGGVCHKRLRKKTMINTMEQSHIYYDGFTEMKKQPRYVIDK